MSILVVDDEEEILSLLKKSFEIEGVEVTTMSDPVAALEYQKDNLVRVVLSDIRMPGMDGVQFVRKIKELNPTAIVFMMTGFSTMSNLIQCIEYGAVDYFTKPLDIDFVIKSVSEALDRSKRWQKDLIKAVRSSKA